MQAMLRAKIYAIAFALSLVCVCAQPRISTAQTQQTVHRQRLSRVLKDIGVGLLTLSSLAGVVQSVAHLEGGKAEDERRALAPYIQIINGEIPASVAPATIRRSKVKKTAATPIVDSPLVPYRIAATLLRDHPQIRIPKGNLLTLSAKEWRIIATSGERPPAFLPVGDGALQRVFLAAKEVSRRSGLRSLVVGSEGKKNDLDRSTEDPPDAFGKAYQIGASERQRILETPNQSERKREERAQRRAADTIADMLIKPEETRLSTRHREALAKVTKSKRITKYAIPVVISLAPAGLAALFTGWATGIFTRRSRRQLK